MIRLIGLVGLILGLSSCGYHLPASVNYAKDCFNGCDRSYSSHLNDFEGRTGDAGTNGVDGQTGATGNVGATGSSGSNGADGQDGAKGETGDDGQDGEHGSNGTDGNDGLDGENATISIFALPTKGACVELVAGQLYIEREGSRHVDVYDNARCSHSGKVYCSNLTIWSSCFIQLDSIYQVQVQGKSEDMTAALIEYHSESE